MAGFDSREWGAYDLVDAEHPGGEAAMNFLIAESFTDSLARLTAEEQKAAKTTAFDLQMNCHDDGYQATVKQIRET